MIPVKFEKSRAMQHFDDLVNGRPLSHDEGKEWTLYEIVQLAGVVKFSLHIFPPAGYEHTWPDISDEMNEALTKGKKTTITAAIELVSQLTGMAYFDKYDAVCDEVVAAEVRASPEEERNSIVEFKRGRRTV